MGTHGRTGIKRLLVGSVAERVLRTAPCPVMVVPPHDVVPTETVSFKHIVCAIDCSDSSLAALRWAVSLAQETDAYLWLLHTIEVPPELRASAVVTETEVDELNTSARADAMNRLRSLIPPRAAGFCSIETATATGEAAHANSAVRGRAPGGPDRDGCAGARSDRPVDFWIENARRGRWRRLSRIECPALRTPVRNARIVRRQR